jgi:hypothetical protein
MHDGDQLQLHFYEFMYSIKPKFNHLTNPRMVILSSAYYSQKQLMIGYDAIVPLLCIYR